LQELLMPPLRNQVDELRVVAHEPSEDRLAVAKIGRPAEELGQAAQLSITLGRRGGPEGPDASW
jgi:hypothetical protein